MTTERDDGTGVHARARERLFAAEIAAALDSTLRVDGETEVGRRAVFGQWLLAALMLLGVAVAVGVGWLRADALRQSQQSDAYDPVFPSLQGDLPHAPGMVVVEDLAALAALPKDVDAVHVSVTSPVLRALGGRRGIRKLSVGGTPSGDDPSPTASVLEGIATMPDLQVLHLMTKSAPRAEAVRQLRAAGQLRTLLVSGDHGAPLDRELATAIAESKGLKMLLLSRVPLTADGVLGLSALPALEWLAVERATYDDAVCAAFGSLRHVRVLDLGGTDDVGTPEARLTADRLRSLAALPRLAELGLRAFACDEDALAALPVSLQSLRLENLRGVTADGVRRLARLRQLRSLLWIAPAVPDLSEAIVDVVRTSPLEQFVWASGPLPGAVWRALETKTRLRSLAVRVGPDAAVFASQLLRYPDLERLRLFLASCPDRPETLRLGELAKLRQLELVPVPPLEQGGLSRLAAEARDLLGERVLVRTW